MANMISDQRQLPKVPYTLIKNFLTYLFNCLVPTGKWLMLISCDNMFQFVGVNVLKVLSEKPTLNQYFELETSFGE